MQWCKLQIHKNYDPKKPSKFLSYLEMNNLYCRGMSGYLPYGVFKWLKNIDNFDVNKISEKSSTGWIFEVDLEYPDELYVLHNDYLLAPEKHSIPYDMLSDYCKTIADEYRIKVGDLKKIIPNLGDMTNYVVNYRNLKLYLALGIKLTKVNRVSKFKQTDWMDIFVNFNMGKRKMLLIALKKSWWLIMSMAKQWKI